MPTTRHLKSVSGRSSYPNIQRVLGRCPERIGMLGSRLGEHDRRPTLALRRLSQFACALAWFLGRWRDLDRRLGWEFGLFIGHDSRESERKDRAHASRAHFPMRGAVQLTPQDVHDPEPKRFRCLLVQAGRQPHAVVCNC